MNPRTVRCLLAGVMVLITLPGCREDDGAEGQVAELSLPEGVDQVLIDMRTPITREGIRRAYLEADTAEYHSESEIHMRPVRVEFYGKDGQLLSEVSAERGILFEANQDMEAYGSVVVLDRVENRRLETEQLRYVRSEDKLYGDEPFVFTQDGGGTVTRGDAFETDPSLNRVFVVRPQGQSNQVDTDG